MTSLTEVSRRLGVALLMGILAAGAGCRQDENRIDVEHLLLEMVDLEKLPRLPDPGFVAAQASSYSRESLKRGEAWFDNRDVGQYVRTESNDGRTEHVLADLAGPGAVTRFWSANPQNSHVTRFYFDGESRPRIAVPLASLFKGETDPFGPVFSYVSGTGGNLYYPLPYAKSLKITVEERDRPLRLYYEIGYRTYPEGIGVVSFDPGASAMWADVQTRVARALSDPRTADAPPGSSWIEARLTILPGETRSLPLVFGEKVVSEWSVSVLDTSEDAPWDHPLRAHNAYRFLILEVAFDGERSIAVPLGDFFGSGPGVNPYENLFFTVEEGGRMTSRLPMPFRTSMEFGLTNVGRGTSTAELRLLLGPRKFTKRDGHLRAQWKTFTRETWPPFDVTLLETSGEGKVVGTVYEIANPVLIWWGEGDQKIFVDGESFPSVFGTGTEDDYGFAYGYNRPFSRPYHAQTRVDGPGSGGHISLNRWYVLDTLTYRSSIRFDQEMWHWMPCRPTWSHVVYWYAKPGGPGPVPVDRDSLAPVDLGNRADQLEPFEGELLAFSASRGQAGTERLANCSRAEHLVWRNGRPGDRLEVRFPVAEAGPYSLELNLCQSPDYGRYRIFVNGKATGTIDGYSSKLYWLHPRLGRHDLRKGDNVLGVELLAPNPEASPGNVFGLDYIFATRIR